MENLAASAAALPPIPQEAVQAYERVMSVLVRKVNSAILQHHEANRWLGKNSRDLLENNHANHVSFMLEVMKKSNFELLARTLPWVYRAYHNQGIAYDYFLAELSAWVIAIEQEIDPELSPTIIEVYRWMLAKHEKIITLSQQSDESPVLDDDLWLGTRAEFLSALKASDHRGCLAVCQQAIALGSDLPALFQFVIFPCMIDVGLRWERGEIGVAGEHEATAIVNKVLTALYVGVDFPEQSRGTALVSASPGERHEMGSWMIATCLELDGWKVVYLGADLPVDEIVSAAGQHHATLVALSVAMPFNLEPLRKTIMKLRANISTQATKIMVGGGLFQRFPFLVDDVEADACPLDCIAAMEWARSI